MHDLAQRRLFTFGCSFTQYWRWPTWADALGHDRGWFQNWGMSGAGNQYIFNSLIECHRRWQLGPNDDVIIMWTNTSREDRYHDSGWQPGGNVYWTDQKPSMTDRGYAIRDFAVIEASRCLLQSWSPRWFFLSMVPLRQNNQENDLAAQQNDNIDDVRDLYACALDCVRPSVLETIFHGRWRLRQAHWRTGEGLPDANDPDRHDFHPTPREHVRYIETVLPEIAVSEAAKHWMWQCQQEIQERRFVWPQPNRPSVRL